jgi:hypothetical protein
MTVGTLYEDFLQLPTLEQGHAGFARGHVDQDFAA